MNEFGSRCEPFEMLISAGSSVVHAGQECPRCEVSSGTEAVPEALLKSLGILISWKMSVVQVCSRRIVLIAVVSLTILLAQLEMHNASQPVILRLQRVQIALSIP